MATLRSQSSALEITFPYARHDAVIYDFRWTWLGADLIAAAVRSEGAETAPLGAWDYKRDRLCDTFDLALDSKRPQSWTPIDPFVTICILPGWVTPGEFTHWHDQPINPTAGEEFPRSWGRGDEFTVYIEFDAVHHLRYEPKCGGLVFGFTLHTDQADLRQFCSDLRREFAECQAQRRSRPSEDDMLWRLTN